jgi:hypothetical protein
MSLFLVVIGTIIVVEVIYRLRRKFCRFGSEIKTTAVESINTIRSKTIPDSSKEKLLQRYAVKLFVQSLILFGLLLLTGSPLGIIVTVNSLNGGNLLEVLLSPGGILLSMLVATIYAVARRLINYG